MTGAAPELSPSSLCTLVIQSSVPAPGAPSPWDSAMGAIEDSISQCTFLQMTYTAENSHTDGNTASGARPRFHPPRSSDPHDTSPAPTRTGCMEDRCPVVSKQPLHSHDAANMSPHISIGPCLDQRRHGSARTCSLHCTLTPAARLHAHACSLHCTLGAIRSGTRYAKWAGGSRSQTHRRAAMVGFTQDDGYVRGVAPTHSCCSRSFSNC
jgi:hypothetical protein